MATVQVCEIYLQELHQVLTVNIGEKIPVYFQQEEGTRNHFCKDLELIVQVF